MAKLPADNAPYAIQVGQRIAQAYANLGELTKDKSATDIAIKLIEQETLRYADYARFYQSLSPANYAHLTRYDQYADQRYLPALLEDYAKLNEAGFDALLKKVQARGVNMERLMGFLQPAEQQQ